MKTRIVKLSELTSLRAKDYFPKGPDTHSLKATLEGTAIVVRNEAGEKVSVQFAGTTDNRTMYAYIHDIGFIGGWQYPHRKMPWSALVDYINEGKVYRDMSDLPKK